MAATSKNYNANQIILGPCDVWVNTALPAASSRITLTNGTPDDVTNTAVIHLGMTEAGVTFEYTPEVQDFTSDELTAPHLSRLISESARITGNFLQVFNWAILEKMTVGGKYNTNSAYEELTFGGVSEITTFPVAVIGKDISGSNEYWVIQLYKTFNRAGFSFTVTRRNQSQAPFEFVGQAITSRPANDQIGNFWHQGAANS